MVPLDSVLLRLLHGRLVFWAPCRSDASPQGGALQHEDACFAAFGSRRRSFCITFRVLVVVSDILRLSAANGLGVDTPSDVGGVHGVRSQISIFVLLVEDQVAVDLQEKRLRHLSMFWQKLGPSAVPEVWKFD